MLVKEPKQKIDGERFSRQTDILNPDVCHSKVHIIGAGATGSLVVLGLAKMGLTNLTIYDKDTIEEHNYATQFFPISCKGKNKAISARETVLEFTDVEIEAIPEFYEEQQLSGIVICALDSMAGRKQIYDNVKENKKVNLIIDPRCGGEIYRLLTIDPSLEIDRKFYEKTLHSDKDAEQVACTARSIVYTVMGISERVCRQVKLYLMNQEYKRDQVVDLINYYQYAT